LRRQAGIRGGVDVHLVALSRRHAIQRDIIAGAGGAALGVGVDNGGFAGVGVIDVGDGLDVNGPVRRLKDGFAFKQIG
jgi:hypothetical protein